MAKVTAKDAKKYIGKDVEAQYEDKVYRGGYRYPGRCVRGTLHEVSGRNALIGYDWHWIPDLQAIIVIDTVL
jgi:hypothetical protein